MNDKFIPKPDEEINHLNTKEETKSVPVKPINITSEDSADKLKEITAKLEQGIKDIFDSDKYKEYLRVMSKFHNYSWGELFTNCYAETRCFIYCRLYSLAKQV